VLQLSLTRWKFLSGDKTKDRAILGMWKSGALIVIAKVTHVIFGFKTTTTANTSWLTWRDVERRAGASKVCALCRESKIL